MKLLSQDLLIQTRKSKIESEYSIGGGYPRHYGPQITKTHQRLSSTQPIGILDENGYERINRVYYEMGYSPCITGRDYKDPIKVLIYE